MVFTKLFFKAAAGRPTNLLSLIKRHSFLQGACQQELISCLMDIHNTIGMKDSHQNGLERERLNMT